MDRKLLYKSNIMDNSVMRENRAARANSDRKIKRKELFSRGRNISVSPDAEKKLSETAKKSSKKALKIAKEEEAYRARFMVYMQEKKQKLAQEKKKNKKPPFLSAVNGKSAHIAAQKSFEFLAPKPFKDRSKLSKTAENKPILKGDQPKSETKPTRVTRNAKSAPNTIAKKTNSGRPFNLKITTPLPTNKVDNICRICVVDNAPEVTPLVKDKIFVFNNVGSVLTSTARKHSTADDGTMSLGLEDVLSPIDGIAPLETTIPEEKPMEKKAEPEATTETNVLNPLDEQQQSAEKKTPERLENKDAEHFYLSPFVTTSRGKGSVKKERRNRDSVYKLELNQSIEEPIEARRRREAVKYFRKMLGDETKRLDEICETWNTYKEENQGMLEEHCIDLIDVATGQTKLLISGKVKQFEKLVDDCEHLAKQFKIPENFLRVQGDISPEDLEGYWNIVKLQIENVDLRLNNLTAWKNNHWKDPDDKSKHKRNPLLAKLMKPKKLKQKIKPKDEVRNLIMKARREYLKNKINNQGCIQDIMFVSKPSRNNLKDNCQFTPAKSPAKRLIKTPYRTPIVFKENRTPNIMMPLQRRLPILQKVTDSDNSYKRRLSETPKTSTNRKSILQSATKNSHKSSDSGSRYTRRPFETPNPSSNRKSFLKSEAKNTQKKSVLFSEKIQYNSPEPKCSNLRRKRSLDDSEETPRVMELRARKVLLRNNISDFLNGLI